MAYKELKRLSRKELLSLLIEIMEENEALRADMAREEAAEDETARIKRQLVELCRESEVLREELKRIRSERREPA